MTTELDRHRVITYRQKVRFKMSLKFFDGRNFPEAFGKHDLKFWTLTCRKWCMEVTGLVGR